MASDIFRICRLCCLLIFLRANSLISEFHFLFQYISHVLLILIFNLVAPEIDHFPISSFVKSHFFFSIVQFLSTSYSVKILLRHTRSNLFLNYRYLKKIFPFYPILWKQSPLTNHLNFNSRKQIFNYIHYNNFTTNIFF